MTKQEYINKLAQSQAGKKIQIGDIPFSQFVEYCEALGLIKIEIEKEKS